jgi:uncharacterized protein YxjI
MTSGSRTTKANAPEIERDGDTVASISKKWFRVRESYGVDVTAGEDVPLILAITVAIDALTTRD